jgi:hypothetical protein
MLKITIPAIELWDEKLNEFVYQKEQTLQLEHSLVSVSKWEAKWCKPFLSSVDKTNEEILDYIKCMTITQNVDPSIYKYLTNDNIQQINDYIKAPMTATTFSKDQTQKHSREVVTSEVVYSWMVDAHIPFECQKWHFNRLLTLIRVWNIRNAPPKKRGKKEIMNRNTALNAARRKQLNSKG